MIVNINRRSLYKVGLGVVLASLTGGHTETKVTENQNRIIQCNIEGSPLSISLNSEIGVSESIAYVVRRYFYEIDSTLTQDDILDASNISDYLLSNNDFIYSDRIKSGFGILINYKVHPPGSDEIFDIFQSMVVEDILKSVEHIVTWGGKHGKKMIAYFGIDDNAAHWSKVKISEYIKSKEISVDQGPGTETDMFSS